MSDLSPTELRQLFLSMTMNVLAGNVDDHNKNFSFMMGRDGVWHITPTYDFTFTIDPSAPGYINCHSMSINGKHSDINRNDLLETAKRYDIKGADALIAKTLDVIRNYPHYAEVAGVDSSWTATIKEEMNDRIESFPR